MYLKLIASADLLESMLIISGFTVGIDAVGKDVRLAAQLFRTVGLSVQLQQWREVDVRSRACQLFIAAIYHLLPFLLATTTYSPSLPSNGTTWS